MNVARLQEETCLLLDFSLLGTPLHLHNPLTIYHTHHPAEVAPLLRLAEQAALAGNWVAGFLSFEAAAAFGLPVHTPTTLPLLWLGVFSHAQAVTFPALPPPALPSLRAEITRTRYCRDLERILAHIGQGESYQVNYTLAAHLSEVDPATLFLALQTAHRHPYAAWLHCDAVTMASFSPELFLQRTGDLLLTAPIKGTCARLAEPAADAALADALLHSPKERAEHLMIVDMARNDLGRVCQIGSVRVEHLFERRLFATVQHLETRVQGRQRPGLTLDQLLAALFPAASITGAPKHRTMEIIRTLEKRPRGLYTGSLLVLRPGGDLVSNVLIRTVTWQGRQRGRIGLGGGIVADSESGREWAEIADKGRFLREVPAPIQLIETLLLDHSGALPRLEQHMRRLQHSAAALGFVCDREQVEAGIRRQAAIWHGESRTPWILRLLLDLAGHFTLERRSCPPFPRTLTVQLAARCVDRLDPLLRHKTTRRQLFDQGLARARESGDQEALFCNQLGHVTEGAIRAIAVSLGGEWYIPPLADGLLASVWREEVREQWQASERSLTLAELQRADAIWMGNGVQGGAQVVRLRDTEGGLLAEWAE
ncbi:MAG: chorismate-binding protein [Magnetococcus sp. XQGC-1]